MQTNSIFTTYAYTIYMKKALATVVIPIHLEEPSELEKISLSQTLSVLHKYPIVFMAATELNTKWYEEFCRGKAEVTVERFEWQGRNAFGELLTNPVYYQRFLPYEYMMICHLDAFVFRDELEKWCSLGYDYIGAVIYNPSFFSPDTPVRKILGFSQPEYFGNGGFAIKKVSTFYHITSKFRAYINFYHWIRRLRKRGFLDDIFLTNHFPKLLRSFKIPPVALAQNFGAEYVDWKESELPFNNHDINSLPFGVHGWIQFHQDFWKPCIRHFGHAI